MKVKLPRAWKVVGAWIGRHSGWINHAVLSILLAALGWFAVQWREVLWPRFGDEVVDWQEMGMDPLQRLSFDVPFLVRHSLPSWLRPVAGAPRPTDDVVILYMDEESALRLGQPPGGPWSRAMHAKLVNWLRKDGAKAVAFDVVFDGESPDDPDFAKAIAAHGNVFLGATINSNTEAPLSPEEAQRFLQVGIATEQLSKRNKTLYKAARGWGLLTFRPVDADYGVRRLFVGNPREGLDPWPAQTWQIAQTLGAALPEDEGSRFAHRWVNYYGPARRIESLSYYRAIVDDGGVPAGFFKDKIVFVGARSQLGSGPKKLLDEFSTPWSRFRARTYTPGVEIHATTYLNLQLHDWLERGSVSAERWAVLLLGLALGALRWLKPWRAVLVAVIAIAALLAVSFHLQWTHRLWWNWAVPVLLQVPLATVLAIASRYYLEERRIRKMRAAVACYLSPDLVDQIDERNFTLEPGGKQIEATMVFTDLEGYTPLSEKLGDSSRLGAELTRYFTRTTDEIFAQKGAVIKFIGDAVFAAWGALLHQPDHAERAVRAAWRLSQVSEMDVEIPQPNGTTDKVHVRTRIGIHTGEVLAGNLGSAVRFDYTLIGDAVNFASRLESANKYTGTTILLSDDTARQLNGKFLLRSLGAFIVKGRAHSAIVHELLGDEPSARPAWLDEFEAGVAAWKRADLELAKRCFTSVIAARGGTDGPSMFYLKQLKDAVAGPTWTGEIVLEGK